MGSSKRKKMIAKDMRAGVQTLTRLPNNAQREPQRRGINVFTISQLMGVTGVDKQGKYQTTTFDNQYFLLTPDDRVRIVQLCTPVLAIISSRQARMAGTKFKITWDKKEEDRIADELKQKAQIYREFKTSDAPEYIIARARIYAELKTKFNELLPDAKNFDNCLLRWKRNLDFQNTNKCDEIMDWFKFPNQEDKWEDYVKKWVFDFHTHGTVAVMKTLMDNRIENLHILPGGSVMPVRQQYVTDSVGYVQMVDGFEPQFFGQDELSFCQYLPLTQKSYGMIPIDALINKVAETLLFDKLMASQADGTRFPEKMIIINDVSPFGDPDSDLKNIPINLDEQKRLEGKINNPLRGGIMTFTGNNATVVDLSRENTMETQRARQKDIREECAMVFNMSNLEVNLTGSEQTSGRSTSETQQEIDQGKGIVPIIKTFCNQHNYDIIPYRYGNGFTLEADLTKNPLDEVQLDTAKWNSGTYTKNEIRVARNDIPLEGDEGNQTNGSPAQNDGSNQQQPLYTKQL